MSTEIFQQVEKMINTCLDRLRGKHKKWVDDDNILITTSLSVLGGAKYAEVRVNLSTHDNRAFAQAFSQKLTALGGTELFCGPRKVDSSRLVPAEPFETLQPSEWAVWFQGVRL